jgi:hypothetical protein
MLRALALSSAFLVGSWLGSSSATADPPPCCKTCRKGKACGDSCIARDKLCEQPKGCACDADDAD